jgi:hypothetical protein
MAREGCPQIAGQPLGRFGSAALTLTALYVVSLIKGQPMPALWPRFYYALLVNGASAPRS